MGAITVQEIGFNHTDYKDIYKYKDKYRPAFLLSHRDKKGSIVLNEHSCFLRYDLENINHQYEIPYTDIRAILSEPITYKSRFSCIQFTIELHSYHQWLDACDKLYEETQDDDIFPDNIMYEEEDYAIYSSVCETRKGTPCSLQEAMSALEKLISKESTSPRN
jgi:hypothetical protein